MTDSTTPGDPSIPPPHPVDPASTPDAAPSEQKPEQQRRKRPRWGRRLLIAAAVLILLLVLLVALLPTLVSTGPGNRLAASIAERFVDGDVRIDGLSVGWTSGASVDSLTIDDPQTSRVLDVADFRSGLTLLSAIRGNYDLGDTTFRAQLPLITVDPEGKTNLHRVFRLDEPSEPTEFDPADLRGSIKGDLLATIQRVNASGEADGPRIDVDLSGLEAAFPDGRVVTHAIPIRLEVAGQDAGTISADGEVTLPTAGTNVPPISEKLALSEVDLEAIETVMAAFGSSDLDLAGILNGEFNVDTGAGTLTGNLAGQGVQFQPRDGTGYAADTLELTLQGSFDVPEGGTGMQTPEQATIETFRLVATTDGGQDEASFSGIIDLVTLQAILGTQEMDNWPNLARDVTLALSTSFATVEGGGPSLGQMEVTGNADMGAVRQRFGDLVPADELSGRFDFTFTNSPEATQFGLAIVARWKVNGENLVYLPPETEPDPALDAQTASALVMAQPDRVSQPPSAPAQPPAEAVEPRRPATFDTMTIDGLAVFAKGSEDQPQGIPTASMNILLANAGETVLTGTFSATDLNAEGSIGELRLNELVLPNYAALQAALGSVAPLPEPTGEGQVPPIRITAAVEMEQDTVRLAEPLVVTADGQPMATVNFAASQVEATETAATWEAQTLGVEIALAVADQVLKPLGLSPSKSEAMAGTVTLATAGDTPFRITTTDPAGTATGRLEARLDGTRLAGFDVAGALPIEFASGVAAVPAQTEPLRANDGYIRLAGTSLDLGTQMLTPPEGDVIDEVGLNPVISDVLGQFINPVFVNPEQANGFFNLQVASAGPLNLADPFGPEGGDVTITFGIRELFIKNDIIGAVAEAGMEQVAADLPARLKQIPGVSQSLLANLDISEEVKEEISSFRGNLADGQVRLVNGLAQSRVTFNIADPRQDSEGEMYPLTFAGDINMETLGANLSFTLPRTLIEKWAGESPGDLVKVFGEKPFQKLIPQGLTLGIAGTSRVPTLDVSDIRQNVFPRAVDAAIEGQLEQRLPEGLRDRLPGGLFR